MTLDEFCASLVRTDAPADLSPLLKALWLDAKGDWDRAHELAQGDGSQRGAWIHAYLHRREGDTNNAAFWYARARKPFPASSLDEEWSAIAEALL